MLRYRDLRIKHEYSSISIRRYDLHINYQLFYRFPLILNEIWKNCRKMWINWDLFRKKISWYVKKYMKSHKIAWKLLNSWIIQRITWKIFEFAWRNIWNILKMHQTSIRLLKFSKNGQIWVTDTEYKKKMKVTNI